MKKIGIGKASGKIILTGEHAVVYGSPAIAVPFLGTKVVVSTEKAAQDEIESLYYDGPITYAPHSLKNILKVMEIAKEKTQLQTPIKLKIESSIPPERGMGSSAAVANAVIRSIFDFADEALTNEKLKEIADLAEKIAHGNPSGIDQAATSGKHPLYFVKGKAFKTFPLNIKGYLIVCDSKMKGRTKEVVEDVALLLEKKPEEKKRLDILGKITDDMKVALTTNHPEIVGNLMNQAQQQLKALTISNPLLDSMIEIGLNSGALGGKLTGGGRGGCVIFLADNIETCETIQQNLNQAGYPTWYQDLRELK